ncbi:MAG: hypothetical protein LLG14_03875 [Nocardiaceae bacterium]|nr:hypothetical protein [Nocardiaceae bacterium]
MIDEVRECFERLRAEFGVLVKPLDGPAWTRARFALGPFPALVELDEESGFASAFVALRGFPEKETTDVLAQLDLPRPLVHSPRFQIDPMLVEYVLEFSEFTVERALQIVATASMMAVQVTEKAWNEIGDGWQQHYGDAGLAPGDANTAEPWRLLRTDPVPFYPWDDLDPEAEGRSPRTVIENLTPGDWTDLEDMLVFAREAQPPLHYEAAEARQFIARCLLLNNEDFLDPAENSRPIEEWSIEHTLATLTRMFVFDATPFTRWLHLFEEGTTSRLLQRVANFSF